MKEKDKCKIKLDNPTQIGPSILELSKLLIYDFYYNYIRKKYGVKAKFLFTDTDSLMHEIEIFMNIFTTVKNYLTSITI